MNILTQILNIEGKNLIIDSILHNFKNNLSDLLDKYINSYKYNNYINFFIELQDTMNNLIKDFIIKIIETIDNIFKNSKERKD